jgi:hypothetical protein
MDASYDKKKEKTMQQCLDMLLLYSDRDSMAYSFDRLISFEAPKS